MTGRREPDDVDQPVGSRDPEPHQVDEIRSTAEEDGVSGRRRPSVDGLARRRPARRYRERLHRVHRGRIRQLPTSSTAGTMFA